ncbi:MAG TPA: HAMP domain-containing sensor histidine kinase [Phycisphaerae bacterium]|nr:HAMP domain-containing sensor histidine kinase [Phycisphaerae bacterium]
MNATRMFQVSLASKCRLLFALAVVLIIASALFVPWRSMESFVHQLKVQRARHLAVLARAQLYPASEDWDQQQAQLDRWWDANSLTLKLPSTKPRFIKLPTGAIWLARQKLRDKLLATGGLLRKQMKGLDRYVGLPIFVQAAVGAWDRLPAEERDRLQASGEKTLIHLARVLTPPGAALDDFQRDAVRRMTEDPSLNEIPRAEHPSGRPTIYRFILAVRGEDTGSGRQPLIGLIDVRLDAPDTDEVLLWTRVMIGLAGVLAGFLAMLVFYLIVQKLILAPVRDLTVLAEDIAGGNLNARAGITTGDEFQELGDAFNAMLTELERARVELETINRSLDTRLGELAETNVALYESNRLKSEFLANVSHELRTPLTSIIGFGDLLRDSAQSDGPMDKARAARFAHNILTSGRMLLDLINDLLDLAKIEAGKVGLHRARLAVQDICEALSDFVRPLVDKKNLTFISEVDEDLPVMRSDAGKLRQVLYNLLSNAIKYTPENGTVTLRAVAEADRRRIRMSVADTGPGIAPEEQEKIFEKFWQMDASVTREHSGSGLGLAISKELIHLMGGTIHVESQPGQGATFIIVLPVECPESARRPLPSLT